MSTSRPTCCDPVQPADQVSVSPEGQVFPLPTPEDHATEFLRLQALVEAQRSQGREIVVVMGVGFVGAVMAGVVADAVHRETGEPLYFVIGMQRPSPRSYWKIPYLNRGQAPVEAEDPEVAPLIARCVNEKQTLTATFSYDALALADVVVVDVQCDYHKNTLGDVRDGHAEIKALEESLQVIGDRIQPHCLVLIETTVPPGTTEYVAYPILKKAFAKRGLGQEHGADSSAGPEPLLAHSYERVMPGRHYVASIRDFWRVCSGVNDQARSRVQQFLGNVLNVEQFPLTVLDRPIESETCKIVENSYRATILAFLDEWSRFAERNAHPHLSQRLAIVHNGIIENHNQLRKKLIELGYTFTSETDTEVVAHLLAHYYQQKPNLLCAFRSTLADLHGAYALGVIHQDEPNTLYCARMGSPLVIGEGSEERFIASDPLALLQVTDQFIYLEEGDHARLTLGSCDIWNRCNDSVSYPALRYEHAAQDLDKGEYRHYMLKEIYEQPVAIANTLEGILAEDHVLTAILGPEAETRLKDIRNVHIVACGTSYHAGLVARYWIEEQAGIPCYVEVASEYRYRQVAVPANTLLLTISQSGETADTLAALRYAKQQGYLTSLAICNVAGSSLAREADWRLLTKAGPEIGVASTKAFTTQLVALLWLTTALAQVNNRAPEMISANVRALKGLPRLVEKVLHLDQYIEELATTFANKHHALFLGRGPHYPIAMEGALKLKEISYIHAEAYAAGELKHGPLALVDENMPVVSVAPSDSLLEKLKSNLQEVSARGGQLITFACERVEMDEGEGITYLKLPWVYESISPIVYTIPLQLLSYHVALVKGTDVDKPRNLAKSVTVE